MSYFKGDCVNNAYQELRISGLTTIPGPEEMKLGLRRLEGMANEFFKNNICVGYNFEEDPDINTESGIRPEYRESFEINLSTRLVSIFGKGSADKVDPVLFRRRDGAYSYLSGATAIVPRVQPSTRMPIGSGNERKGNILNRFYIPMVDETTCDTIEFTIDPDSPGEVFGSDWLAWLEGATLLTSEWIIDSGITGFDESFDDTTTTIWIKGGESGGSYKAINRVTSTDIPRGTDRTIIFNVRNK